MKLVIYIFTIYLLVLSLVPCSDGGSGIVEIANHFFGVEHQHISDHNQHSNSCGDDSCTPFCVCSCCSIALDLPAKLPFLAQYLPPTPDKLPIAFPNFKPISFHHSIWQPPKFS